MKPKIIRHYFKYFLPISKKVLAKDATVWYNRYVADFEVWPSLVGRYVRDTILTNSLVLSRTPTNLLTPPLYGDLKNKIHVVKQVLTTCSPTDTGIQKKLNILFRDIAQFGSALRSGRRGRRFKSCYPDHLKPQ